MHKRDEYLRNAEDYQDFRQRREVSRYLPPDELEDEPKGHAKIHGRQDGGIIVTHVLEDGDEQEHHFTREQYAEAIDHLHRLIADDFIGKEESSKGETSNESY